MATVLDRSWRGGAGAVPIAREHRGVQAEVVSLAKRGAGSNGAERGSEGVVPFARDDDAGPKEQAWWYWTWQYW